MVFGNGDQAVILKGTVDEDAAVTVQSKPAGADTNLVFQAQADVSVGTNTVSVVAQDYSSNVSTNSFHVVVANDVSKSLTYDDNGNLTSDGTKTYDWDAEDRLIKITEGSNTSEFTYDGLSRRVRIVEKTDETVNSDKRFLWCGTEICEERDSTGATVAKRFYGQGVEDNGTGFFYTRDHLGSIREVVDSTQTVRARYDYDPYGRRTKLTGDKDADFGFTGHYYHAPSGLHLALYRAYDAETGRWLSRDPIGEQAGYNLYSYVENDPVYWIDPLGLKTVSIGSQGQIGYGFGISFSNQIAVGWSKRDGFTVGWSLTFAGGFHLGTSASLSEAVTVTDACSVADLAGPGYERGASAAVGPVSVGGALVREGPVQPFVVDPQGTGFPPGAPVTSIGKEKYNGYEVTLGIGRGTPEGHLYNTATVTIGNQGVHGPWD